MAQEARPPGFVVLYVEPESAVHQHIHQGLVEAQVLETIAELLNSTFVLPREVTLAAAELGTANAFYSSEHHAVFLSYELLAHFLEAFGVDGKDEQAAQLAAGAFCFVMFHEIGHCLINELELPAVGKEEDAVDEFATLLLLQAGETGEVAILGAASWFASKGENNDSTPFWDEHSLDMQRFFGIFTMLYATNPERYGETARGLGISEERLAKATVEYRKKEAAWSRLLEPHVRQ